MPRFHCNAQYVQCNIVLFLSVFLNTLTLIIPFDDVPKYDRPLCLYMGWKGSMQVGGYFTNKLEHISVFQTIHCIAILNIFSSWKYFK